LYEEEGDIDDPEQKGGFFRNLFKRKTPDSTKVEQSKKTVPGVKDTIITPAELRQQRREQRRKEREIKRNDGL
jgi:hypothetical protein